MSYDLVTKSFVGLVLRIVIQYLGCTCNFFHCLK